MHHIEKFLKKVPEKDRLKINNTAKYIAAGKTEYLNIKKLKGFDDLYRVKIGRYRVIFKKHRSGIVEVVRTQNRDDNTYKFW